MAASLANGTLDRVSEQSSALVSGNGHGENTIQENGNNHTKKKNNKEAEKRRRRRKQKKKGDRHGEDKNSTEDQQSDANFDDEEAGKVTLNPKTVVSCGQIIWTPFFLDQ